MMVSRNTTQSEEVSSFSSSRRPRYSKSKKVFTFHRMTWICLILASLGASWFAYQCFLVPQAQSFAPGWGNSEWVQASDGIAPVAYFRYTMGLDALPDGAFVTIAASQTFKLYVNGTYIGSNYTDFVQGIFPRAYIYDIASALRVGANVLAIRVANVDEHVPGLRANLGIVRGNFVYYRGSDSGWVGTSQSEKVYPRYTTDVRSWTKANFDASSWPSSQKMANEPASPMLMVNPLLYERPTATRWISAGSGHDAYFVRQISLPFGITGAWLRLAAAGDAEIYINGHLFIIWNGQAYVAHQNLADYLSDSEQTVEYRAGLAMGLYDITTFLHPGANTIAVHVLSPGVSSAQVGLDNLSAAMSEDMLFSNFMGQSSWLISTGDWHVSAKPVSGWEQGSDASLRWPAPVLIGRPGAVNALYLPDNSTPRNQQMIPLPLLLFVIFICLVGVVGIWLLMSLYVMRRFYRSLIDALEAMSLAYLPAVALEVLLIALSREPQMPLPFPYTLSWGMILLVIVGISYLFLWLNARTLRKQARTIEAFKKVTTLSMRIVPLRDGLLRLYRTTPGATSSRERNPSPRTQVLIWLRSHWMLILLILVAIPMICYDLSYEPYWQDELASYYASRGVLAYGLPFFPSGFLYTKSELFSYLLALWTTLFGQQQGIPRLISAIEYLLSLPLLYRVGCYFFDRRIALFATAMLAFSPISLIWGRQMRMYEQAQLLTLLTVYLFYRALQERQKIHLVYLAAGCLIVDYLSHEEIFIILPAILLCVLIFSRDKQHRLPTVLYQKHWWIAGAICTSVIALQLLAARLTPPPILGTDSSERPLVQFTTDNIPFYVKLLFFPNSLGHGTYPQIAINSILATAGCIWARRATDKRVHYCAVFLVVSLLTLTFAFTLEADRYIYPILPFYYLMGAYGMLVILRALWNFASIRIVLHKPERTARSIFGGYLSRPMSILVACTTGLLCASVLIVPILPLSSYNLFISRVVGFSYHRHYPDYDAVGQYMQQHMKPGDIVIAVSPAVSVRYYVGHVDYFFSVDRALFLLERNAHIIETASGAEALLNQDDFQAVLSKYKRIWIISDNGVYQSQTMQRFTFPPDFHIVFEGYGSAVYFRGD